jgi:heme exporter protein A
MIRVQGLVKSFGHTYALRGVDLQVAQGQFLTILGPNGAGKTTLLRILATLLKATSGLVAMNGVELSSGDATIRRQIGFVSHQPLLYDNLTVEENLRFYGRIYDVGSLDRRVDELLDIVGLDGRRHSLARTLSRGMRQRLSVARSVIHDPAIMLMDEPYTGLDQQAARMLPDLLRSLSTHARTVVMTTHNLQQGLELCDRVVILARGRVAYQAERAALTVAELQGAYWVHTQGSSGRGAG